jgi:hypothetical protein
LTVNKLKKSVTEEEIKKCLKKWFLKEERALLATERALPPMEYGEGKNIPDVIAYKKRANTVYLVECKKASTLRNVGYAFGQVLADELSLTKIRRRELQKKLQKLTGKSNLNGLKLLFGVAFPKKHYEEIKGIKTMIKMMHQEEPFKNFAVYIVDTVNTNVDNSVTRKHRGKQIKY